VRDEDEALPVADLLEDEVPAVHGLCSISARMRSIRSARSAVSS
jgi:hypothetical protein